MVIVLRSSKDSALSFAEMDGNFTDLDTRISAIDSAHIKQIAGTDSANMRLVIQDHADSTYVKGFISQSYVRDFIDSNYIAKFSLDSDEVIKSIVDSDYVQTRQGGQPLFNHIRVEHDANIQSFMVTVDTKNAEHRYNGSGAADGYKIGGIFSPHIQLVPGRSYRFDQSDTTNTGRLLKFYYEANKTTPYTTGVTVNGTPGNAGAYTQIDVGDNTPKVLHYMDSSANFVGNQISTDTRNFTGFTTGNLTEGSNLYYTTARVDTRIQTIVDANYIQARQNFRDSEFVTNIVDSAYVLGIQDMTDVKTDIIPNADSAFDLGSPTKRFKDLHLSGSTINLGSLKLKDSGGSLSLTDSTGDLKQMKFKDQFDSSTTVGVINSTVDNSYVQSRQDKNYASLVGAPTIPDAHRIIAGNTDISITDIGTGKIQVVTDGVNRFTIEGTDLKPNANNGMNIGGTSNRINDIQTTDIAATGTATLSGTVNFGGATIQGLDVVDSASIVQLIDSAYVQARETTYGNAEVTALVDAAYVQARQLNFDALLDSSEVIQLIDSNYVSGRVDRGLFVDSEEVKGFIDSDYIQLHQRPEQDTLTTVTGRGASTSNAITLTGGLSVTGILTTDSIQNAGIGFGTLTSGSDIQLNAVGDVNVLNSKITNVGAPVANTDAATKLYVDSNAAVQGVNDFFVAKLAAQTTTTTTASPLNFDNTPLMDYSPTVGYSFSGTNAVATDTPGYYKVEGDVTWYKAAGEGELKIIIEKGSGGSFSEIPGARAVIFLPNSAGHGSSHVQGMVQMAANDAVRLVVDQVSYASTSNTGNYVSSNTISGSASFPGATTFTIMKVG